MRSVSWVLAMALGLSNMATHAHGAPVPGREEMLLQLGAEAGLDEQKSKGLRPQLEAELAMRSLLEQRAIDAGIDKLPRVAASVELARQNALAQAYLDQLEKRMVPTEAELRADYDSAYPEKKMARVKFAIYALDERAAKALDALRKGESTIEEVAKQGDDRLLAQKQGDFGAIPLDAMPEQVASAIAAEPEKKWPDKAIKTMYGSMVYELNGVSRGREKTYEEALGDLGARRRQLMLKVELAKLKIEAQKESLEKK